MKAYLIFAKGFENLDNMEDLPMTSTVVEKTISIDENICYVLNKCCSVKGYAYRLGYVNPKKLHVPQIIYKKTVHLPKRYSVEICVQCGAWDNPMHENCWTDITLYSPDGRELIYSEPQDTFTGVHQIEFDNKNYVVSITS
jgi:hypothetical protein